MSTELVTSPSYTLRLGTPEDAAELAALGRRTFRETFGPVNRVEDIEAYVTSTYTEAKQRAELLDPRWYNLMAVHDGVLIGFAQLREGPAPGCVTGPDPIELLRIYVDAPWQGQGLAQALMAEVIDEARRRGGRTLHLGVWEHNTRALAFYARYGFREVGDRSFKLGGTVDRDLIVAREI